MQHTGLVSGTGNASLWQKNGCRPHHLLCPSYSPEKLSWLELSREDRGDAGKWLLLGRDKKEELPFPVLLTVKTSSTFPSHLSSHQGCDQGPPLAPYPLVFARLPPPQAGKGTGPTALGSPSGCKPALPETHLAWVCSCDTAESLTCIIRLSHSELPCCCIAPCLGFAVFLT